MQKICEINYESSLENVKEHRRCEKSKYLSFQTDESSRDGFCCVWMNYWVNTRNLPLANWKWKCCPPSQRHRVYSTEAALKDEKEMQLPLGFFGFVLSYTSTNETCAFGCS